ncbi:hypothetical protein FRC19_010997 [Serendipita sp. 401]|nr:hypothetical protein FRC18_000923 [Serendipita sp. 400]KAG8817922.1 hypothetical protein FRC19_010997 [Serendipita sp. 401]KAG9051912.1 hypothetical protein FS842_010830 [Serendipita sp. 407]
MPFIALFLSTITLLDVLAGFTLSALETFSERVQLHVRMRSQSGGLASAFDDGRYHHTSILVNTLSQTLRGLSTRNSNVHDGRCFSNRGLPLESSPSWRMVWRK